MPKCDNRFNPHAFCARREMVLSHQRPENPLSSFAALHFAVGGEELMGPKCCRHRCSKVTNGMHIQFAHGTTHFVIRLCYTFNFHFTILIAATDSLLLRLIGRIYLKCALEAKEVLICHLPQVKRKVNFVYTLNKI